MMEWPRLSVVLRDLCIALSLLRLNCLSASLFIATRTALSCDEKLDRTVRSPSLTSSSALEPVPATARKPEIWIPKWVGDCVLLLVIALVVIIFEVSIHLYIPAVYTSDAVYWIARFVEAQLLMNMLAARFCAYKDNACYQLNRLRISSKRLEKLATQRCIDKKGVESFACKWCYFCKRNVPARTVHCGFCGFCSLRNDHHCFVVNTCLGIATLRYFVMMGIWLCGVGIWGIYCFVEARRDKVDDDGSWLFYVGSAYPVVCDVLGVHALGFNMFRWYSMGYRPTLMNSLPWMSYLLCAVSFMAGSSIFAMETFFLYKGYAMMEFLLKKSKPLRGDRTIPFMDRVRFIHGDLFYLNFLLPRFWEDVNWTPAFVRTLITHPFDVEDII